MLKMKHETQSCVLVHLFVHQDVDDRVPHDRALGHLEREDGDEDGDGVGEAEDARQGEDGVRRPAEQEHEHKNKNLKKEEGKLNLCLEYTFSGHSLNM